MNPADFGMTPEMFYMAATVVFFILCLVALLFLKFIDGIIYRFTSNTLNKRSRLMFQLVVWLLILGGFSMMAKGIA